MIDDLIEIRNIDSWDEFQIVDLYKSADWWKECYDPSEINKLIENSFSFAVAIDKKTNKAVGMGRLLSDGVSDAYIQDLVVLNEYRGEGIGKKIVKFLLDVCEKNHIQWIGLISEPNQDLFYEKIGFKKMKNYIPMRYMGVK